MNSIPGRALFIGMSAAIVTFLAWLAVFFFSYGRVRPHEAEGIARMALVAGAIGFMLGPFAYHSILRARSWVGAFFIGVLNALLIFATLVAIAELRDTTPTIKHFIIGLTFAFVTVGWATTPLGGIIALFIYAFPPHGAQQGVSGLLPQAQVKPTSDRDA